MHVVFGCNGPLGGTLMGVLKAHGHAVRGISRTGKSQAPPGVEVVVGDAMDRGSARKVCAGASVVHCCIGIDYRRWPAAFPQIVEGVLAGAEAANATLIFADNLYAYGPQNTPLVETMAPTSYGKKPALRASMTRTLLDAHQQGRVRVAIARAADFYGPRVRNSALGERVFPNALAGRPATLVGDMNQPHTFTYVPDFARALATLSEDERALGQVWHVPSAPARPTREVVEEIYRIAGRPLRVRALASWMVGALAPVVPIMRELAEMRFQWDRPYLVDHSKFAATFWGDFIPFDVGLRETLSWWRSMRECASMAA